MMRHCGRILGCILLSVSLVGCANIQNDGTRTTTEGALVGAGGGALLGAGIGALIGGGRGAAWGAGIGAALGGTGGYFVGKNIAQKKADYASQEDWLDACIAEARQVNAEAASYNANLRTEIAALEKKSVQLAASYKKNKTSRASMQAELKQVKARQTEVAQNIKNLETQMRGQQSAVAEARKSGNTKEAAALDAELAKMKKQVAQMKSYNAKLASISARMAV